MRKRLVRTWGFAILLVLWFFLMADGTTGGASGGASDGTSAGEPPLSSLVAAATELGDRPFPILALVGAGLGGMTLALHFAAWRWAH